MDIIKNGLFFFLLLSTVFLPILGQVSFAAEPTTNQQPSPPRFSVGEMGRPDVLLVTKKLSDFPKDLVSQGVIKDLLTDEFAFYYKETEGYLSLNGVFKRIAYEHELSVFDRFLVLILNQPAEVAFWKAYNGKLDHYMAVFDKSIFTDFLTAVTKIASSDSQLKKVSEKQEAGEKIAVYQLQYKNNRSIYFSSFGKKVAIFSDSEMLLPTEERLKNWITTASQPSGAREGTFSRLFESSAPTSKHSLYFTLRFLSFGYQKYFPALEKLKFSFNASNGWETQGLFRGKLMQGKLDGQSVWQVTPKGPSFCSLLPLSSSTAKEFIGKSLPDKKIDPKTLSNALRSPAAICWYAGSKIFSPLFIVKVDKSISSAMLRSVFEKAVGNFEAGILSPEDLQAKQEQQRMRAAGEPVGDPIQPKFEPSAPVSEVKSKMGIVWSREVSSRYGILDAAKSTYRKKMKSKKYFNVRLALWKEYLVFSPDAKLVDNTIAVIEKKYPALSDSVSGQKNIGFVITPPKLSELLKQATLESLPAEQESIYRESVSKRLFPIFDRMKKLPTYSVVFPDSLATAQDRWEDLKWQSSSVK